MNFLSIHIFFFYARIEIPFTITIWRCTTWIHVEIKIHPGRVSTDDDHLNFIGGEWLVVSEFESWFFGSNQAMCSCDDCGCTIVFNNTFFSNNMFHGLKFQWNFVYGCLHAHFPKLFISFSSVLFFEVENKDQRSFWWFLMNILIELLRFQKSSRSVMRVCALILW